MARPRKTGLDYFPFDVGFFEDEKIACIAGEFGIKGEVIAIRLLCAVYKNKGYFAEWNEQLMYKLSRETQGVSAQLVEQIVRRLAKWGFFDETLLNSASILTSRAIQRRYFEAVRLRKIEMESLRKEYLLDPKIIKSLETPVSNKETGVSLPINATNKIKLNEIKKEDKSSQKKAEAVDELRIQIDEYKNRQSWLEGMAMKFKISIPEIFEKLEAFYLDMKCKDMKVQKFPIFFIYWLSDQLNKNQNENNQTDRFSARRGTEPGSKSRKGFKGTF